MLISKELPADRGLGVEAHSGSVTSSRPARVASIDIFRGLTMVVMVFVNQLGEMKGMPWWTVHMPANINAMTYVDMVFPFFLFIVGMSLPLAIQHRLSKGDSELGLWAHVAVRSVGLMVLGLILANREKVDAQLTHMAQNIWTLLALLGAILFWISYPDSLRYKNLFRAVKISGLVLLWRCWPSSGDLPLRATLPGLILPIGRSLESLAGLILACAFFTFPPAAGGGCRLHGSSLYL